MRRLNLKSFFARYKITFSIFFIAISVAFYFGGVLVSAVQYNWIARTGAGSRYWSSITSSSDGTKLAATVGGTGGTPHSGYIYTSTDSGATWTERASAGSRNWSRITSSSDGTKLAATESMSGVQGYIYTSSNSGVTWTPRPSAGSRYWSSITSSSDGTKLAAVENNYGVGTNSYIFTSSDSGATWTERFGISTIGWMSITSSSDGNKLVAATLGGPFSIYTSTDGGVNWIGRFVGGGWQTITSSSDGTKLAAIRPVGYLYTSTDSGVTWTQRTSAGSRSWISITSSSDGTELAVADRAGYIYTSSDSGATWVEQTGSGTKYWTSITSSSDGTKLAAVDSFSQGTGNVYTSNDYCTWAGSYPPQLTVTSPYPNQTINPGASFEIQGSFRYHMTNASDQNVLVEWSNHDGSQSGSKTIYSTSQSCNGDGCTHYDNTSNFSLADYGVSAITAPSVAGTYRFYVTAKSINSCSTDVVSGYQDYTVPSPLCGTANDTFTYPAPSGSSLCYSGTPSPVSTTATNYIWSCSNGIPSDTKYCSANINHTLRCSPDQYCPVDGGCYNPETSTQSPCSQLNSVSSITLRSPKIINKGSACQISWTLDNHNPNTRCKIYNVDKPTSEFYEYSSALSSNTGSWSPTPIVDSKYKMDCWQVDPVDDSTVANSTKSSNEEVCRINFSSGEFN